MKKLHSMVPGTARPQLTIQTLRFLAFILLFAMVQLGGLQVSAQGTTGVDLAQLGLTVNASTAPVAVGQSATVSIEVGNGLPIAGATGYEVWVELHPGARIVPSLQPEMSGCWILEPSSAVTEVAPAAGNRTYRYTYQRTGPATGAGAVLHLHIISDAIDLPANRLVAKAGGLMQIDNLELRTASPTLSISPNPYTLAAASPLQVRNSTAPIVQTRIVALDGHAVAAFGPTEMPVLQGLLPGTYWVQSTLTDGQVLTTKLAVL